MTGTRTPPGGAATTGARIAAAAVPVPAASGEFLLGVWLDAGADPLALLTACARRYGDAVQVPFGSAHAVLLAHPRHVTDVLVRRAAAFRRDRAFLARFRPELGGGLITAEGEAWQRRRRLVGPALRPGHGEPWARAARDATERMLARITGPVVGDLRRDAAALHRAILERALLGTSGAAAGGVAALLAAARDGDDRLRPHELDEELRTLRFAGADTTESALAWTLAALAAHPDVQQRCATEVVGVAGGRPLAAADVRGLPALRRVITEALRLHPPTAYVTREAATDVDLDGHRLAAGTTVVLSPWVTQRDPRFFADPLRFDPDRWDGPARAARAAYFPFGAGARSCVGRSAALLEVAVVAATVLASHRLSLEPDPPLEPVLDTTVRPRAGVRVRWEPA